MKHYFIKDEKEAFWCQNYDNGMGYWSSFESSKKYRFEGILIWVFPLYLIMKVSGVKCKMEMKE